MRSTRQRVARALVVVVVAGVVYAFLIPQTRVDRQLLGRLVITRTATPGVPRVAQVSVSVQPSESTFATTRQAAKSDPHASGIYGREWYVASDAPPESGLVIQLLPTAAQAARVAQGDRKELKTAPSLEDEAAKSPSLFSVPGVAGAGGAAFVLVDTTTSSQPPVGSAYKLEVQVGRVVVSELMVTTSATRDLTPIRTDARREVALLERVLPPFSFAHTSLALLPSLAFLGITVVAVAGVVVVPEWFVSWRSWRRRRRHDRDERRSREQYLARGRRTVRRQRAPAWSQPRRR